MSAVNLAIVSRDLPRFIAEVLSGFPCIQLGSGADGEINNIINRFIEVVVEDLSAYRQFSEPLRVHVKEVFQRRAQGILLSVRIVANQLVHYEMTEVEEAVDRFPSGLDELYACLLLQIDENQRETAAKILRWVVMAVRPLTIAELDAAIEIVPSEIFTSIKATKGAFGTMHTF